MAVYRSNDVSMAEGCLVKWTHISSGVVLEWSRSQMLTLYSGCDIVRGVRRPRIGRAGRMRRFSRLKWSKKLSYDDAVAYVRDNFPSVTLRFDNSDDWPIQDFELPANEIPAYSPFTNDMQPASEVYPDFESHLERLAARAKAGLPLFSDGPAVDLEVEESIRCVGCNKLIPGSKRSVLENGWVRRLNRTSASYKCHNIYDHSCPACYYEYGFGDEAEVAAYSKSISCG